MGTPPGTTSGAQATSLAVASARAVSTKMFLQSLRLSKPASRGLRQLASKMPEEKVAQTHRLLERILGKENVSRSAAVREQHGRDESYHTCVPPDIVATPTSTQLVSEVARACWLDDLAMIPFGTGTGMEGGVVATQGGVCIDVSKMEQVTAFHPDDFDVTVQAGVKRKSLNNYVKGHGLWFPVDPGADASLGGMCATQASGTNAVRYGTMRENVMNLEVVLADGTVLHTAGKGRRTRKSSAGYNLTNLFVGSEGTLGIITEATLKLHGIPDTMSSAVCHFESVKDAVDATVQVLQSGVSIARIELLDEVMMMATNRYSGLSYAEKPSLFLEFHGNSKAQVEEQTAIVEAIMQGSGGSDFVWAVDSEERSKLWTARHNCLYAALALRPGCTQMSTDVCVPISNLAQIITEAKQLLVDGGLTAPVLGHVGDGNFHVTLVFDAHSSAEVALIKAFSDTVARRALSLNGTCTGEHGIGLGKSKFLQQEFGDAGLGVMRSIKAALDPKGLMNPGKVLP